MQVAHYLSELWKKEKGVFYETPCKLLDVAKFLFCLNLVMI